MKKLLKVLGKQLIKINWFRREVEAYRLEQLEQKKRLHRKDLELIMGGNAMRDAKTEKDDHRTLATISDEGH